jgi:hypothetical protein
VSTRWNPPSAPCSSPSFDRPPKDLSFGTILLRLFDISRRFDMRIQPRLILLQKTLLNIEGLGRDLYPELDIWQTAAPILREWMSDRISPRAQVKHIRRNRTLIGTALGFGSLLWIGFGLPPSLVGWLLLLASAVVLWRARRRG